MLKNIAYFAWGSAHKDNPTESFATSVVTALQNLGIHLTHFTMSLDERQTRGAKPLSQLATHKKWQESSFAKTDELALFSFPTDEFLTVFDAEVYIAFSRGDKTVEPMEFRTDDMLYRMKMDRIVFFAPGDFATEPELIEVGDAVSKLFIDKDQSEVKRVVDLGTASLYASGANFHLREEFYTKEKITEF